MYNKLWNTTYKELREKLEREPTTKEVYLEMLDKMFNSNELEDKNDTE